MIGICLARTSFIIGAFERNAGAFYDFVGAKDALFSVSAFFELDAFGFEHGAVFGRYFAKVAQKDIHAFILGENCRAGAAFACTEYYKAFACLSMLAYF